MPAVLITGEARLLPGVFGALESAPVTDPSGDGAMMIKKFSLFALFLCLCSATAASPLFDHDDVIELELIGPLSTLIDNKAERAELPFVLRLDDIDHQVMVRARGHSRLRVCQFPPLRLRFVAGHEKDRRFDDIDTLKLVTHCLNSDAGEQNVLEEFLAYRIFGIFSEVSYRARLLRITYSDSAGRLPERAHRRFGFVLEPKVNLSRRVEGELLRESGIKLSHLNQDQAALVYVFQYLIGNTDWSFVVAEGDDSCCHNGELIEAGKEIFYVPYDFDLSGLVNARYAKPPASLHIRSVRRRVYRGFCIDRSTLRKAISHVRSLEKDVMAEVRNLPNPADRDSGWAEKYLAGFFEKAADEEKLLKSFEKRCLD